MPRRAASLREIAERVAALEERIARLELGRPPPGDGRTRHPEARTGTRCPGCGLKLRRRNGRCAECGMPLVPGPAGSRRGPRRPSKA